MYGTEYDYESITHYPANAFSRNEMPTIISKQSEGDKVMVNSRLTCVMKLYVLFNRGKGRILAQEILLGLIECIIVHNKTCDELKSFELN